VEGTSFDEGVAAFQEVWKRADPPQAITVQFFAALGPGGAGDRRRRRRLTPLGRDDEVRRGHLWLVELAPPHRRALYCSFDTALIAGTGTTLVRVRC
jgi:hypothetical protein